MTLSVCVVMSHCGEVKLTERSLVIPLLCDVGTEGTLGIFRGSGLLSVVVTFALMGLSFK